MAPAPGAQDAAFGARHSVRARHMTTESSNDRPRGSASDAAMRYTTALREASGRVPEHHVDWDAFHARLSARAELTLARLRYPHLAHRAPDAVGHEHRLDRPAARAWW